MRWCHLAVGTARPLATHAVREVDSSLEQQQQQDSTFSLLWWCCILNISSNEEESDLGGRVWRPPASMVTPSMLWMHIEPAGAIHTPAVMMTECGALVNKHCYA